jgi:hypothetical protein
MVRRWEDRDVTSFESLVSEARSTPFEGWDFSWLASRTATEPLPWSYAEIVESYAASAHRMLDMGTGGGELLSTLGTAPVTVTTEAWPPNAPIAARRLRPLGIPVVRDEGAPDNIDQADERGRLPFRTAAFDLVINRHEAFLAAEVARVLDRPGVFITQQVDFRSYDDLLSALGAPVPDQPDTWLPLARAQLADAGLRVVRAEVGNEILRFNDIGAVLYYAKVVAGAAKLETIVATNAHESALRRLHARLQFQPLQIRQKRLLVVAEHCGRTLTQPQR